MTNFNAYLEKIITSAKQAKLHGYFELVVSHYNMRQNNINAIEVKNALTEIGVTCAYCKKGIAVYA